MRTFICFGGWPKLRYMYFDTEDYLADSIFAKNGITVYPGPEWINNNEPYRIIECKIKRSSRRKFENSFEEVARKMMLTGHHDYEKYCDDMIRKIEE